VLDGPFASRVKDHFAPLLGFQRDPVTSSDPLGDWWQQCYLLRNNVVHRGHQPTFVEVDRAFGVAHALHNEVGKRLSSDPNLHALHLPIPSDVWDEADRIRRARRT
jgi:hypothetical protein